MSTKLLTAVTILLLPLYLFGQFTWDGGAGTTNWQDANNWNPNIVPTVGALVAINTDVTITGLATNNPGSITIGGASEVVLDLSMIIGDGIIVEHGIIINANSSLTIAAGHAIFIDVPVTRRGVVIGSGANGAMFKTENTSNLIIQQAQDGIYSNNATATISNAGAITIGGITEDGVKLLNGTFDNTGSISIIAPGRDGIDNRGTFNNNGTLEIEDADRFGIINSAAGSINNNATLTISSPSGLTDDGIRTRGAFVNQSGGMITITGADDDAIEIPEGSFTNESTINVTAQDAASATNNGISVGTTTTMASFTNSSTGTVNADGGAGALGRAIFVFNMGTLENSGLMNFTNGNDGARLYTRGVVTNKVGGTLDMMDGRINVNLGTLTNNGLILSTRGTPGVFNLATATNNGFFDYAGSGNFASGGGTTTDNGIDINDASQTTIDAGGGCTVDIAEAEYEYFEGANSVGTTNASGSITFMSVLSADPVTISNELGVSITLENFCAAALPIELSYFKATPDRDRVLLKWQTSAEINNDYMAVERSNNGRTYTEIGRLKGAGNSNQILDYQLTDYTPSAGVNYYRLRQADFDGTTNYSDIVSVDFKTNNKQFRVYPTLIESDVELNVDLSQITSPEVSLELIDMNGRRIRTYQLKGGESHTLNVSELEAGMYVLKGLGAHQDLITRITKI